MNTFADMPELFGAATRWQQSCGHRPRLTTDIIGTTWIAKFSPACPDCGVAMFAYDRIEDRLSHDDAVTIDHIVARGLGGTNDLTNQRCICKSCNNAKSLIEWRIANGVAA